MTERLITLGFVFVFIVLGNIWYNDISHESIVVSSIILVGTELLGFVAIWRIVDLYHFMKDNNDDS